MVQSIQILSLLGITRSLGAPTGPLFKGVGRPDILAKIVILNVLILALIVYPLTAAYGVTGTAMAVVIPNILTSFVAFGIVIKFLKIKPFESIKQVICPDVSAIIITVTLLWIKSVVVINIPLMILFSFLSIILYALIMYFFDIVANLDLSNTLKTIVLALNQNHTIAKKGVPNE